MTKRYLPVFLAVLLLAVASVGAFAASDRTDPPSAGLSQVTTVQADTEEAMAVLEEPRASSDRLPVSLARQIDERATFGMNPDLSRLSIANATNSVYVIPARDHVCVSLTVGDGADLSCPSTDDVANGRAAPATVTLETGGIGIYGIVPDGVDSVSVQTGTSDSEVVATDGNTYYTVVAPGTALRSLSYDGPSGTVEFPIYDPSQAIEE